VPPLESIDVHRLSAAMGWLELGNVAEAEAELRLIGPAGADHPDVLATGFAIHAHRSDWRAALPFAARLVQQAPGRVGGWLHRAYAVRRMSGGGLAAAWELLLPAAEKFPDEPTVSYNLACYAAQLGRLEDAWAWFERAVRAGGREPIRKMALTDADLEPLHGRIRKL
jgi:predicted Zn-dependent protease